MNRLRVYREGSTVSLGVYSWLAGTEFKFSFGAGSEWAARLVHQTIVDVLHDSCESIRRTSYTEGWRDKSAKKKKATWFSRDLP